MRRLGDIVDLPFAFLELRPKKKELKILQKFAQTNKCRENWLVLEPDRIAGTPSIDAETQHIELLLAWTCAAVVDLIASAVALTAGNFCLQPIPLLLTTICPIEALACPPSSPFLTPGDLNRPCDTL